MKKLLSVVVPVYNEEQGIAHFLDTLLFPVLKELRQDFRLEIILVNDGSSDGTLQILQQYAQKFPEVKVIAFSRNFGKEPALSAGLANASGDLVLTIDADGQQPPQLIPEFIQAWQEGADVVTGVRDHYTKHGMIPKLGSRLFYKLLRMMGNTYTVAGSTDFRLMDRTVVDEFNRLAEHNRITRGLVDWLGFKPRYIKYVYGERFAGKPSYNLKKLFALAIDSFVAMSTTPLLIFGYIGIIITILSFLLGTFCLVNQYLLGDPLGLYWNGSVQMAILIAFLVGLVLISQAITALYISHIHAETQGRPLYIIDHKASRNLQK